jgi:hypothetical protein
MMRRRFLENYTRPNILYAFSVFYGDRYNLEGKRRAKKKIHSIQYWLRLYYSKRYKDKNKYRNEARECFEQLQEELNKTT